MQNPTINRLAAYDNLMTAAGRAKDATVRTNFLNKAAQLLRAPADAPSFKIRRGWRETTPQVNWYRAAGLVGAVVFCAAAWLSVVAMVAYAFFRHG